jgi:hypothetical protein
MCYVRSITALLVFMIGCGEQAYDSSYIVISNDGHGMRGVLIFLSCAALVYEVVHHGFQLL